MWILLTLGCLPTDRFNIVSRVGFMQGTYYCMRLMGGVVCSCVHRRGPVRPSKHTYMTRIPNEVGTSAREIMVRCCATNVYMYRCCGLCCRMLSGRCILYWCARALMRCAVMVWVFRTLVPFSWMEGRFREWNDAVLRIQGGLGLGFIVMEKRL